MPSFFQSISSYFSGQREGSHLRRDQAMISVDDAFTVPPDAEYVSTPSSYTYPPTAQGGSYDTVPQSYAHASYDLRSPLSVGSSSGLRPRQTSVLPFHHAPLSPLPKYPPLQQTWSRLRSWLDVHYPELADTLNWGIQPPELAHLELELGFTLPQVVRESYLIVDGQEAESSAGCSEGLFFGLTLLPFEDVVEEWRFWREVDEDPSTGANPELRQHMSSIPPGWIRREYSQRGWLPLVADKAGNYLGVDMNPDEQGSVGQVIVFGRDFDTKVVMWRGEGENGWARWLASFADELESGEGFDLGGGDGSEGSEDDLGYDSYFFDGSGSGKGQGSGDSGGGGPRLTGEYRGWTVLEAFADRSMRRWIQAGLVPQLKAPNEEGESSNAVELSAFGIEASLSHSVYDKQGRESSPGLSQSNENVGSSKAHTSNKSYSKAPAPLPVEVPTQQDLLPSPSYSSPTETTAVYEVDEEMVLSMRELDRTTPVQANFTTSVKEVTFVPLPPNAGSLPLNPSNPSQNSPNTPSSPPTRRSTDFSDTQALLEGAIPIDSNPAGIINAANASQTALSSTILIPTPAESLKTDSSESHKLEEEPRPSVLLVGGDSTYSETSFVDGADSHDASISSKKNSLDNVLSGSCDQRQGEAA